MTTENVPLTSVVMVSYHTGAVLDQAIASVLAQTAPVELCLVDNGNPPDVVEKLRAHAAADSRIKFISGHGNVGFSRGCNLGAQAGRGAFLLFLNPDSVLPPDSIARLLAHGATLKAPYMFGARLLDPDGTDQRGCRRALLTPATALVEALHLGAFFPSKRLNFDRDPVPDRITPMPAISGAFMFLPRTDFDRIHGFDEAYFLHVEDIDICLRFRRAGGEIYFVPDIVVMHVGSTSKAPKAFIERNKAHGFVRYFFTHFRGETPWLLLGMLYVSIWGGTYLKLALSKRSAR